MRIDAEISEVFMATVHFFSFTSMIFLNRSISGVR